LYEQHEHHHAAIETYRRIPSSALFYPAAQLRIGINLHMIGEAKQALRQVQALLSQDPLNAQLIMVLGDMYRLEKDYRQAARVFATAPSREPERAWGWEFFYKYAIALDKSGDWPQAEAMLMRALEVEPEQADVLNYLGYSWLERNERLEEAKELIVRAHAQDSFAAHIIDSLGWAHFKLGNYEQAAEYLEQALQLAPTEPTINDHLGDAFWRLGRQIEARFQWQRALTFDVENPDAVRHKLQHGLPALTP
jgi:Flp pilus assembly protein TadD